MHLGFVLGYEKNRYIQMPVPFIINTFRGTRNKDTTLGTEPCGQKHSETKQHDACEYIQQTDRCSLVYGHVGHTIITGRIYA